MEPVTLEEERQVEAFLYKEARLADQSRYAEWEDLVDDDMYYWIPAGDPDADPERTISITADNRKRLATRLAQLKTGMRHAQLPVSPMARLLSNIEIVKYPEPKRGNTTEYRANANFVIYELRAQSTQALEVWPGRVEYGLRKYGNGDFRMFFKKVMLVNASEPILTAAFIL